MREHYYIKVKGNPPAGDSLCLQLNYPCKLREGGVLADIAPTMLKMLGLPKPEEMTGESIII